jgi:flagellin-like hook-associated protein FlgL
VSLFSGTDHAPLVDDTIDGKRRHVHDDGCQPDRDGLQRRDRGDISTSTGAVAALTAVTTAITQLATDRANVGANEERLNYTGDELGVLQDNLTAANSNL